jgi:hypothetical protein
MLLLTPPPLRLSMLFLCAVKLHALLTLCLCDFPSRLVLLQLRWSATLLLTPPPLRLSISLLCAVKLHALLTLGL